STHSHPSSPQHARLHIVIPPLPTRRSSDLGMKAWGEHYAVRALVEDPDLAIYQVSRPARGCLSYIVASAGKAIVIDPLRHLHPRSEEHTSELLSQFNIVCSLLYEQNHIVSV